MRNLLTLDNWFFIKTNPTNKDEILQKLEAYESVDSMGFEFKPFEVPGTLQSNIARIKSINPYFEKNMDELDSCENDALLLVCEFNVAEPVLNGFLLFDYIDTISEIFLNRTLIGETANAFIQHEIPIPENLLVKGKNLLSVYLSPAMSFVDNNADLPEIRDRVFTRRPTYNYGWDFAPRAVLLGIGKARIVEKGELSIESIFVNTEEIDDQNADVTIELEIETQVKGIYQFIIEISTTDSDDICYHKEFKVELVEGRNYLAKRIKILNPLLWWPNGYGEQPIYEIKVAEKNTDSYFKTRFGIRKVKLILEESDEKIFVFEINNRKIWAKGANWVPTDALTNYSDEEKYVNLLKLAKKANFNMLRIWGGGVVEKGVFYDTCDNYGLMIWHDFQFACSFYPEDEKYLNNVEQEVTQIVKRLRNHPSIVIWCGNNENEWIYSMNFPDEYKNGTERGYKLHELKGKICSTLDPSRPYWRSSPWGPANDPNSQEEGNNHDWNVWHAMVGYENYAKNFAKFVTEFGIQALPVKETIDRIFSFQTQEQPNDAWTFHNIDLEKIKINMEKIGNPMSIEEWILYSQAVQALGLKFAIEIWRSRKFETAGSLIWQFNEPWPTICWSLVDYYSRPKMAYWLVKRAYEPVIIVYDADKQEIIIVNDLQEELIGLLRVRELELPGEITRTEVYDIVIPSDGTKRLTYQFHQQSDRKILLLDLIHQYNHVQGKAIGCFLPIDPINMEFPDPEISVYINKEEKELFMKSNEFAFMVNITSNIIIGDNYFILFPNEPYYVKLDDIPEENTIKLRVWNNSEKEIKIEEQIVEEGEPTPIFF
ncbi:MAG: glycoside hydrolase family 2 protein [Candidatus Hodarchaeales archaeon]|jgi:beta-mannosidase